MDRASFEAALTRDGYEIVSVTMKPDTVNPTHVHAFDARLLVVEGAMTIDREAAPTRTYQAGETFDMPSGTHHSESAGGAGASYVAGRRAPTKQL
jgi:quercetin dioxygenase-like cupin family protein